MRSILTFIAVIFLAFSCKKEAGKEVVGTVVAPGGPGAGSFLVQIDNPNANIYSFICKDNGTMPPVQQISCFTHIFILNLPANLQAPGTRIRFNKYDDKGPNPIWSSTLVPRDVQVYNATQLP